ncbi:protein polybromo-1 isoform X3 [Nilaparvata lugens]|uniref:protein polybromo-1 isoform X2 n=1 Tax=Nilaparvata lugens TaxID=108931 RepID=UPI00193C8D4F|nr:protein polybromo-1 isoform X2 [Nilaparvata lugens]XP_039291349.1 protein polybromo-1 isoform X3 [Nilaparvata lugens]
MNKRRRTSSVASRGVDDEDEPQQAEPTRKRKRLDPMEIVQLVYDVIRNHKKDDGSLLCDAFIRAPKRRQEPSYYEVVTNPIDLLKVQQKIKTDEYEHVEQLQADIELLVNNTKAFYKRQSPEYKDATELMDLFLSTKNKLVDNGKSSDEGSLEAHSKGKIVLKVGKLAKKSDQAAQPQPPTLSARQLRLEEREREQREREQREKEREEDGGGGENAGEEELNMCEELFTAVMTATDPNTNDNRPLHTMFQLLPSVKRYPKYYEVIESPIDLRTIARKLQAAEYTCLADMDRDLQLMTRNACAFNEPGSQIYKDAKTLKKIISSRRIEIEHGKVAREGKTSERIRNKRLRGSQSLSAITAALPSDDSEEEEEEEEDGAGGGEGDAEEENNPRWQLFQAVKNATSPQGALLSEPFWKLPSKRYYPDYYKEIRNAISLMQIGKKLKRGDYGTVSEVAGDMNIMFENAKKYNRPDSKLYKDAVKLQKVMQSKVQELLECDHQYSDSDEEEGGGGVGKRGGRGAGVSTPHRCITRGKYMHNIPLKRRLYSLCKCLIDYVCEDGRQPMLMFMEKPSKKLYPDYYEVIENPIDMLTIEANIKAEKYTNQDEILNDFKLMFRNCRQYNEEQSMIYEDAIRLERVLMEKVKELGPEQGANPATNTPTPQSAPPQKKINKVVKQAVDSTPRTVTKTKRLTTAHNTLLSPSVSLSDKPLPPPATLQKMRTLYNTLRDYRDPRGRQLSLIFLRLPSKIEYPDYYEVIKRPINLETISHKLKTNAYEGLDEIVADFVLMFDNACKYNEPDSQIYKDALMLQRVCLQTKLQLREDEEAVPDVISAVQELLTSLFTAVYNHQDEEGRCFSDSMAELPEHDEVEGKRQRALSLDLIKRRLDGMQYRRLDLFQEDLFSCLERARRLSPAADSQVFEDSVELQSFFIRQRDELCRNGDLLHSPALNYTLMDLSAAVDATRMRKQQQQKEEEEGKEGEKEEAEEEPVDEEAETRSSEDGAKSVDGGVTVRGTADNAMSFNQQVYRIGDFVYAEAKERGMEPMLLNIQRLWTSVDGQQMLYANQFYRPRETYHVTTRKFLEKEVFKTEQHVALPLNKVVGRCCVLSVKDYFRAKPTAFDDKDIYVCESRYSSKARAFKKIKNWPSSLSNNYKLEPREKVLEPIRNMSVFRERVEKHKEEIAELEEQEKLVIKEKPNVPLETNNELNVTYYEQYNHKGIVIKTGDCVYLKADGKQAIAQIDTIWTNVNGLAFIRGPWMLLPKDLRNCAMRIFYKQEIFLSTVEDTIPVDTVVGKCAVLEHSEYISCRPTEIPEADVYLCESKFDEAKQLFRELPRDGLKKYTHSSAVTQDEIYFFRRLLNPPRVGVTGEVITLPSADRSHSHHHTYMHHYDSSNCGSSPVVTKLESEMMLDDSLDGVGGVGGPPSVNSDTGLAGGGGSFSSVLATPTSTKKTNKMSGKKLVTGYILYSGDIRKGIASSNPDKGFGEVSRMVGNEWRKLPTSEKIAYEEKAARLNEETTAKFAEQEQQQQQLLLAGGAGLSGAGVGGKVGVAGGVGGAGKVTAIGGAAKVETCAVFECAWDSCDHQFEDMVDCIEHAVADSTGHVQQFFAAIPPTDVEYQCQWKTCIRMKKQCAPFPSLHRLARHVKEVHIMKSTGRLIPVDQRSKNYTPSRNKGANRFHPTPVTPAGNMQRGLSSNIISSHARNTPSPHSQNGATFAAQKPVEPLFVTVPPRPQRLLHSDAYVKYIENLSAESRSISNWEKQLRASQLDQSQTAAQIDVAKLPAHWLANGTANHGNVVNALWTLRDYMFRDALGLSKIV